MFYYMVVTVTTVGYGDIYPNTEAGQYLFIIIEISVLSAIPIQAMEYQKVNNLTSSYSRSVYQQSKKDVKHILLLGDSKPDAIKHFLMECFHADHAG